MQIRIGFLFLFTITFSSISSLFAQKDYKKGTTHKDGYTTIYIYTFTTNKDGSTNPIYRYGLLNEKKNKIVLPIMYKNIYTTYEDGIYSIKDTFENEGLYSTDKNKIIIEPKYSKIEMFSEGVAKVQKKIEGSEKYGFATYQYGAINTDGKLILPDTFSFLGKYKDGLMNFRQDGKYGYINKNGKIIIPATYQNANDFSCGLSAIRLADRGKYGYINTKNEFVIEPKYIYADDFYNDYAIVYAVKRFFGDAGRNDKNKVILIDKNGKELTEPIYESISLKKLGGVFVVEKDNKKGLIDSTGKILLPIEYTEIKDFYSNITTVEKAKGIYGVINNKGEFLLPVTYNYISPIYTTDDFFYAKKDNKSTVYDKNVKVVVPTDTALRVILGKKYIAYIFENAVKVFDKEGKLIKTFPQENVDVNNVSFFSDYDSIRINSSTIISLFNLKSNSKENIDIDDVSDFNSDGIFVGKKNGQWSFYDYTGKKLFSPSFVNVVNFSEGICGLQESTYSTPYLANKSLTKIATLTTVFYGPYSEGLAMAKSQYGSTVYYLNKEGKTQFSVPGTDGYPSKDGRIKIKNNLNKFLFVDTAGKAIGKNTFDILGDFYDGYAGFNLNKKGGFIDTSGNIAIPAQYDEVSNFSSGTAIVKLGNDYFQINKAARPINNNKYLAASNPYNGTFPVKTKTGYGLIDSKGKTIIDFKYDEVVAMYEDRVWAKKNNKFGLLDNYGVEVTPFIYDASTNFDKGYCTVTKNGKSGVMDKTGKLVLPMEYTKMGKIYNNTILVVRPYISNSYAIK